MTASEKIKTINKKIEQNKAQYNLDRQTAKMSALSSGNVGKYEFFTGQDVLPEKYLLEKAAAIKRFECSQLCSELKKKQYQGLDKVCEFDKKKYSKNLANKNKNKKTVDLKYGSRFDLYK